MFRSIFVALLSLNLLFAAWQFVVRPMLESETAVASADQTAEQASANELSENTAIEEEQQLEQPSTPSVAKLDFLKTCYHFGPLKGKRNLRYARARLAKAKVPGDVIVERTQMASDYWVYIDPQPSRKKAERLLSKLQSRGIDSYIISDGEKVNGISLGFFTKESYAAETRAERIEQGYKAKMEMVERFKERYTLQITENDYAETDEAVWKDLATVQRGTTFESTNCQAIADATALE